MAVATVTLEGNTKVEVPASLGTRVMAAQIAGEKAVTCTRAELIGLLSGISRKEYNQFVGITTDTEPRLVGGKKNPLVGLRKISHYSVRFHVWKEAVDNQLSRDGVDNPDYQPASPKGKEYVGDSPVMVGNTPNTAGTYYLAVIPVRGSKPTVSYYHPSIAELDNKAVEASVYKSDTGAKQRRAGADKPLAYRSPKIENITMLAFGGFEFHVIG